MNKPLVSVCIITYNQIKYIEDTVESVLSQKVDFAWEIIIADDYSMDGTREILLEYQRKYPELIRLILQTRNVGPADNWRDLMTAPQGKYIAYIEGDDYWIDVYKLQKQVNYLESNPEYGLCFTDADVLVASSNELIKSFDATRKRKIPTGDVLLDLIHDNPYKTCTVMIKKIAIEGYWEILEANKFKIGDWSLWLHVAKNNKVGYLNESTSFYRILENSASHSDNYTQFKTFIKNGTDVRNFYSNNYGVKVNYVRIKMMNFKSLIAYIVKKNKHLLFFRNIIKK